MGRDDAEGSTIMTGRCGSDRPWFAWRLGRLAWSSERDEVTYDERGTWKRALGSVWVLVVARRSDGRVPCDECGERVELRGAHFDVDDGEWICASCLQRLGAEGGA